MGLIPASAGKAVAQNAGLSGGHPGNSGLDVVARQSRVAGSQVLGETLRQRRCLRRPAD
jgi:hypothetical protein